MRILYELFLPYIVSSIRLFLLLELIGKVGHYNLNRYDAMIYLIYILVVRATKKLREKSS